MLINLQFFVNKVQSKRMLVVFPNMTTLEYRAINYMYMSIETTNMQQACIIDILCIPLNCQVGTAYFLSQYRGKSIHCYVVAFLVFIW